MFRINEIWVYIRCDKNFEISKNVTEFQKIINCLKLRYFGVVVLASDVWLNSIYATWKGLLMINILGHY